MISVAAFNAAGDGPHSEPTRGRTQQAGGAGGGAGEHGEGRIGSKDITQHWICWIDIALSCSTVQLTVWHSTPRYSIVQVSITRSITIQVSTSSRYSIVQISTARYGPVQKSTVRYSTVQIMGGYH